MFKVLIVDDDFSFRIKLKTMVDWEKVGFEIYGEATNGLNAIQMIDSDCPDVIVTDMSMPVMDGIGLIECIENKYPHIKVIVLSGYDDFEYVRRSMKRGTVDYILKHQLSETTLLAVLKTAVSDIVKEKQEDHQKQHIQKQLTVSKNILKQNFLNQLVAGEINDTSEIERTISSLGIEIDTRNLALIVTEIDDFMVIKEKYSIKEIKTLVQSFLDISEKTLSGFGKTEIFHADNNKFIIIVSLGNVHSDLFIYNQLVSIIDNIKLNIKRFINVTACWSISHVCNDITDIKKYYDGAERQLKDKFFKGKDKIIREGVTEVNNKKEIFRLSVKDEKNLEKLLRYLDQQKVDEYVEYIFDEVLARKLNYKSVQMICAELINIANKVAREVGIEAVAMYSKDETPYNEIQRYESFTDLKQWILGIYGRLITALSVLNIKSDYSELTRKAIEYINSNYQRNISLNDVAGYLGINSTYLSHMFKEECKKGFVEYLNTLRVVKAKQLIGSIKLKDIVHEIGFNNYNYFLKVFKDITGMTPVEYEETLK
jgi:two-component system, response regulator YesN